MNRKKELLITALAIVIVAIGGTVKCLVYLNYASNKIVSTLTLDINPSIEINLNKKEKVISIIPLNEDAKDIINEDLKGKTLDTTLETITSKVVEKGYVEDKEVVILINAVGDIKASNVEGKIKKSFKEKEIEVSILVQEKSKTAKDNAEKYNISESKASYIEKIIEQNKNLTFEDLKDKSISELKEINNPQENVVEDKSDEKEEVKQETNISSNKTTSNSSKTTKKGTTSKKTTTSKRYSNQPADPTKDLDAWCAYNKNGNPYGHEKPMMISESTQLKKMKTYLMNKYNVSEYDFISSSAHTQIDDNRSSYCVSTVLTFITRDFYKVFYMDSVTGTIIEEINKGKPAINLTEQEALQIALNHYKIKEEDIESPNILLSAVGLPDMSNLPVYQVSFTNKKDGKRYHVDIDAKTKKIRRTW